MFLDCERKPEYPERTHACTGRRWKLHAERPPAVTRPRNFLLQGNSATNCATVQPSLLFMVLRPPGGGSNISLGADEEKPPVRKNKMASSVFAEPEDPYANRRNNPPGMI
ncbi:hypothetical protein ILYODFUR_018194 [Ilyodon furcidens]|uniref:Uncharacterized protein n=1 Tax=Ilyodon furcidens TaxID=33524 RepID=A0ABV0SM76_9TELE